jgi:hypothetical protein
MHKLLTNPNTRFSLALGASIGIGMPLFRGLTENLGPITGLLAFLPIHAGIVLGISLLLELVAKKQQKSNVGEQA